MINDWHIGRRFNGPDSLSHECDCPKTGCGLTVFGSWDPDCTFHGLTKTIRQGHAPEDCHITCVDCGHSTAPIWFGQPGSGSHSEDDGSCFDCGPDAKPCPSLTGEDE